MKATVKRRNWVYHSVVKPKQCDRQFALKPVVIGFDPARFGDKGVSEKVLVADDGVFEYAPDINSKPLTYEQIQEKLKEL